MNATRESLLQVLEYSGALCQVAYQQRDQKFDDTGSKLEATIFKQAADRYWQVWELVKDGLPVPVLSVQSPASQVLRSFLDSRQFDVLKDFMVLDGSVVFAHAYLLSAEVPLYYVVASDKSDKDRENEWGGIFQEEFHPDHLQLPSRQ